MTIALTFDDGPDAVWTTAVLRRLERAGATATFFVLADRVRRSSQLVRTIVSAGHTVGIHGGRHVRHTAMTEAQGQVDLDDAIEAITATGAPVPRLWRTPWGVEAAWTRRLASARGLELVGWTSDTHDWRGDSADVMLAAVKPDLAAGAIVLAHDGLGPGARRRGCQETVALIEPLVGAARALGLPAVALR